ncbi:hypothetical protein NECID01_2191, partial [Nematocida sp. AWRm77]
HSPLLESQVSALKEKVAAHGGYVSGVYKHVLHGVSVCGKSSTFSSLQDILFGVFGSSLDLVEENKIYNLAYKQEGLPDNFYTLINSRKVLFHVPSLDRVMNKYVRNSYLVKKSLLFKWYRDRYMSLSSVQTGKGITVFVVDGGIGKMHKEVNGRVRVVKTAEASTDQHATSVITAAGGETTGLAKESLFVLYPVFKMGVGYLSDILAALEHMAPYMQPNRSVLLLSFSGEASFILDEALGHFHDRGIHIVAAAGNNKTSACHFRPGRSKYVVTVGSFSDSLEPEAWSNTGSCVDMYAPGTVTVGVDKPGKTDRYTTQEGTSLSAAYTAGYIAQMIQAQKVTPSTLKQILENKEELSVVPIPQEESSHPVITGSFEQYVFVYDLLFIITLLVFLGLTAFLLRKETTVFVKRKSRK